MVHRGDNLLEVLLYGFEHRDDIVFKSLNCKNGIKVKGSKLEKVIYQLEKVIDLSNDDLLIKWD